MKKYLIITLVISILLGIILPLALGVKDISLIGMTFSSVWFVYAVLTSYHNLPNQTWPENQGNPSEWNIRG